MISSDFAPSNFVKTSARHFQVLYPSFSFVRLPLSLAAFGFWAIIIPIDRCRIVMRWGGVYLYFCYKNAAFVIRGRRLIE